MMDFIREIAHLIKVFYAGRISLSRIFRQTLKNKQFSPKKSFTVGRSKIDRTVGRKKSTSTDRPTENDRLRTLYTSATHF